MSTNNLRVIELETSNSLNTSLGIIDSRVDELIKMLQHAEIDYNTISSVGAEVSKGCNHANELWYIAVMFGMKMGQEQAHMMMMQMMGKGE
jgi:hypothetical protein